MVKDRDMEGGVLYVGIIEIGDGAKIGAGAIVLKDVPPCATVVGGHAHRVITRVDLNQ